jgi:hypothetical protein
VTNAAKTRSRDQKKQDRRRHEKLLQNLHTAISILALSLWDALAVHDTARLNLRTSADHSNQVNLLSFVAVRATVEEEPIVCQLNSRVAFVGRGNLLCVHVFEAPQVRLNLVTINLLSLDDSSLSCAASATLLATSSSETWGELIGLFESAEGIDILVGLRNDLGHWGELEGSRGQNCAALEVGSGLRRSRALKWI